MLQVSNDRLEYWRKKREGPQWVRLSHKVVRYRQSAIDAWLDERAGGRADG